VNADELQEINRLRLVARVVSNAVHEVNNALQVVFGSAELLGLRSQIGPAEQLRIQKIGESTSRAALSLQRLAAYTRPDDGGCRLFDLAELVNTAVALRAFTLRRAHISVTVDRGESSPCQASVDRPLILQVLLNLLLNAEAALAEREDPTIGIRLERSDDVCRVSVTDSGPGISATEWVRAVDAATLPSLGPGLTGLGLWTSARIARRHMGHLELTETPGGGGSVALVLPAAG